MQEGKRFKVVVADARPHLEGRVLRERLIKRGTACTYILLNGVACVIGVCCATASSLSRSLYCPLLDHPVCMSRYGASTVLVHTERAASGRQRQWDVAYTLS